MVCKFWRRDKCLVPARIGTPNRPAHSLIIVLTLKFKSGRLYVVNVGIVELMVAVESSI